MKSVGFLVNPIAGMGGAVGLKGTDGRKTLRDAVRKGAKPVSLERGLRFLEEVQRRSQGIEFLTAPGNMGASIADQLKLEHESVGRIGKTTTSDDSIRIARLMRRKRADLIVFCGGDGTARDVLEGVGGEAETNVRLADPLDRLDGRQQSRDGDGAGGRGEEPAASETHGGGTPERGWVTAKSVWVPRASSARSPRHPRRRGCPARRRRFR